MSRGACALPPEPDGASPLPGASGARPAAVVVDTSERGVTYLIPSRHGSFIRLSANAHTLLRLQQRGASSHEVAADVSRRTRTPVSAGDVEAAWRHIAARIGHIEQTGGRDPFGFWFRLPLLPARVVARVARPLSVAFAPRVAAVLGAVVALAVAWGLTLDYRGAVSSGDFWAGYALLLLSLLAHEFGHASACARYGAAPSTIGCTVYLIYPALYSDVTAAWLLKRRERVVVDLGGLYFQLVVAAGYVAAYAATGWAPLRLALLMTAASCVFSMNPAFRFDGYWVVADALGVLNLGQQSARVAGHYWARLRRRPTPVLPWPAPVRRATAAYAAASFAVWSYFVVATLPSAWAHLAAYPAAVSHVRAALGGRAAPAGAYGDALTATFAAATSALALVGLTRRVARPLARAPWRPARPPAIPS